MLLGRIKIMDSCWQTYAFVKCGIMYVHQHKKTHIIQVEHKFTFHRVSRVFWTVWKFGENSHSDTRIYICVNDFYIISLKKKKKNTRISAFYNDTTTELVVRFVNYEGRPNFKGFSWPQVLKKKISINAVRKTNRSSAPDSNRGISIAESMRGSRL